jgi:hypothetical protein
MEVIQAMIRTNLVILTVLIPVGLLLIGLTGCVSPADTAIAASSPILVTLTPTLCPVATPEPLWVEPITSPADQLTQTITVYLGNGEAVTVTAESGTFAAPGNFDAFANPARVDVALLANTVHHLRVFGKVRTVEWDGCVYGGYTLSTIWDRYGGPLVITQVLTIRSVMHFPLVLVDHPTSTVLIR